MPRNIVIYAITLVLLAAIGLVIYGQTRTAEATFDDKLVELLPPPPPGWTRIEQPIADTPEMRQKVDELLNFDDGVFYVYTFGSLRLSVYAAYWKPGKMSSRLVAGHTPDVCWVGAGWQCTEREAVDGRLVDGKRLPRVETRTFTVNESNEYVWFWHLVEGVPQSYDTGKQPPWYAAVTDMVEQGLDQRNEQFFIRLSSPQPINDPSLEPILKHVLDALPL